MNDVWKVEEIELGDPNTLSDVNDGLAAMHGGTNLRGLSSERKAR